MVSESQVLDPDRFDLNRFDLNLLIVFEAVFRERSVTRAAERLHLSQPAISHSLNRLRRLMDDGLFHRGPAGMEPTLRAELLAAGIHGALGELRGALAPSTFDPASAQRTFRIAVNNYAAVVVAPNLIMNCLAVAPGVRLSIRPSGGIDLRDAIERGDLDLAISSPNAVAPGRIESQPLLEDEYVALTRRRHPGLVEPMTLETFARLPRLNVSSSGDDMSFIDRLLDTEGLDQKIILDAPYLSLSMTLARTDMVAVLARRFAMAVAAGVDFAVSELRFEAPAALTSLFWSRQAHKDPAHVWLRRMVVDSPAP